MTPLLLCLGLLDASETITMAEASRLAVNCFLLGAAFVSVIWAVYSIGRRDRHE